MRNMAEDHARTEAPRDPPLVTVVVSTYNRPERLARLLSGLACQALAPETFEVIVVDNGSAGTATQDVLARELQRGRLRLRTVRHARTLGPAGGRNSGWRLAEAPLVGFTDDDCVPEERWLAAALAASRAHPGAIVQGPTRPDPGERHRDGILSHTVRIERLGPQYETCNIFYPRAVLEALGGFDESFGRFPAGEDTDLAWRALETGSGSVFASQAAVHHAVEPIGARGMLRLAARWSEAVGLFSAHPQLRSMLERGIFWNVWHYLMWRSLLALAAPRWLRRMLLTGHLLELRERARRAGAGSRAIPYLIVHDLVECGAIARGALRHRTLVL